MLVVYYALIVPGKHLKHNILATRIELPIFAADGIHCQCSRSFNRAIELIYGQPPDN